MGTPERPPHSASSDRPEDQGLGQKLGCGSNPHSWSPPARQLLRPWEPTQVSPPPARPAPHHRAESPACLCVGGLRVGARGREHVMDSTGDGPARCGRVARTLRRLSPRLLPGTEMTGQPGEGREKGDPRAGSARGKGEPGSRRLRGRRGWGHTVGGLVLLHELGLVPRSVLS